jgi:hypothetical protein
MHGGPTVNSWRNGVTTIGPPLVSELLRTTNPVAPLSVVASAKTLTPM